MTMNKDNLTKLQKSFNSFLTKPSITLSQYLNEQIHYKINKIKNMNNSFLDNYTSNFLESDLNAVHISCKGDIRIEIVVIISNPDAKKIVSILLNQNTPDNLDPKTTSVISEIGNVLTCTFVNSLTNATGIQILATPPEFTVNPINLILETPILEISRITNKIIIADASILGKKSGIKINMFFILPVQNAEKIISSTKS